jgi:tetratricopeptide (TPR) repeat protein
VIELLLALGTAAQEVPTFSEHVAPIVFAHCASCHRPGQSAPFDLLTYRDVQKRAGQVLQVTSSGYMPPWLPAAGEHAFEGARSLSGEQLETLRRWAEGGAPEGDPERTPQPPKWASGWQLGEPDLILTPATPFELAADGTDVFRNLILTSPLGAQRYVAAIELRPANPSVHHAIVQVDTSGECRVLASDDEEAGFAGMSMGASEPPDGHFLGWTPGRVATAAPPGLAWRLPAAADLVLQLHLTPTGKPEQVRPEVGLYFTERPPDRFPYSIVLYEDQLDIPAGEAAYTVRDQYVLPIDVLAHGVYPHAHFLGKRVRLTARSPSGVESELLRIEDWDFNWQDEYRYREPLALAAGTKLTMEWTFDNSAANVRNPNQPPARVRFGQRSEDEMATISLHVIPVRADELGELKKKRWRDTVERHPWDWRACNHLASLLLEEGDLDGAGKMLERGLSMNPQDPDALTNLGFLLQRQGGHAQATDLFERALRIEPDHAMANVRIAVSMAATGGAERAIAHLRAVLERAPHVFGAHVELGNLLALGGAPERAVEHYLTALELRPGVPEAHNNLANTYLFLDRPARAIEQYRLAVAARPDYFNAHYNLGRVLIQEGEREAGLEHLREAAHLRPDDERARAALEEAER